jgi:hypothetical protein
LTFRQFSTKSKIIGETLLLVGLIGLGWRLPHLLAKDQAPPAATTHLLPVG